MPTKAQRVEEIQYNVIQDVSPNLQSIPPELRLMIFEYVLVNEGSIILSTDLPCYTGSTPGHQTVENFRALSVQCREMHYEAESIFFTRNTFRLLANRNFPAIPPRYVETLREIELYRTLMGKTFVLKIHRAQGGSVIASVEVFELEKEDPKESISRSISQIENIIVGRLAKGAEVAAGMIRKSVEGGNGMSMAVMKAVAAQMNQQWIIAI